MAAYKDRVTRDLERWIEAGFVAPERRTEILATIPDTRRLDAATALAWIGGLLLGIAVIAFIAANWDGLPRLAKFTLINTAFLSAAGAGAWAAHRERPIFSNIALMLATLLFAAAIGLTGQIFDIAGDPQAMLRGAAVAGVALALAGRSTGAACAALILFGLGDFSGEFWQMGPREPAPWLLYAAPFGVALALHWRSAALAHIASLGMMIAATWLSMRYGDDGVIQLVCAMLFAGIAAGARWFYLQERDHAGVFYGWFALTALIFFAIAGYADGNWGLPHRALWLVGAGALIALGRHDRHLVVTGVGVVGIAAAIIAILVDLELDLGTAALVFFLCAGVAAAAGFALKKAKTS